DYDLHQWDLNDDDRAAWFAQINKSDSNQSSEQKQPIVQREDVLQSSLEKESAEERIYVFNDIKCVNLSEGESLNQLATTYEIGINRLMRYNDATDLSQLKAGDRVYLQPKRNHGDEKFHTVKEGETMLSISQQHGIRLDKLYEKNLMKDGTQPAAGEIIYLQDDRDSPPKTIDETDQNKINIQKSLSNSSSLQFHTVAKGDTLFSISKKYNVSVDELRNMNQLDSNDLAIGEKLRVK
ncbi:MAG: LysM peptidoglycan-binding domain-containing protein, partial [Chitinophagales bacterium]